MSKLPYLKFDEVYPLATIEDLADMLSLQFQRGRPNFRCKCPVHDTGNDKSLSVSPHVRSKKGSLGVFQCFRDHDERTRKGDRIALVAHVMELGQQEAAHFIKDHFRPDVDERPVHRASREAPARQEAPRREMRDTSAPFDREKFAKHLVWHDDMSDLGLTEEQAKELMIGFHPQQKYLYIPIRWPTGEVAGWFGYREGEALKVPPRWIPANVVSFRKTA